MQPIPRDFLKYYQDKRASSRQRKIEWLLTCEECWSLWQPYWQQRTVRQGYSGWTLSRYDDQGAYEITNCRIIPHGDNTRERMRTRGNPQGQHCAVTVEGRRYPSLGEAHRGEGVSMATLRKRLASDQWPLWRRVD